MAEERVGWLAVWFVRQKRPRHAKLNLVINIPALTHTQAQCFCSLSAEWSLPAVFMIYQPSSLAVSALLAFCLAAKPRKLRLLPHPADEMCPGDLCVCTRGGGCAPLVGALRVSQPSWCVSHLILFPLCSQDDPISVCGVIDFNLLDLREIYILRRRATRVRKLVCDFTKADDDDYESRSALSRKRRDNWRFARKSVFQRILTKCVCPE